MAEDSARYRVEGTLGRGGMGEVRLAYDTRLDRRVALKLLTPSLSEDGSAARRLLHEAKSLAALDHPFICKTYEIGEMDGRPFLAMEYVEGSTLRERLTRGPLPLREALTLAIEIADALDYAHRRGVVHRDLKPSNVMLTPEGHAKLLDFGIARRLPVVTASGAEETRALTVTEAQFSGTLEYMSPEQLEGKVADAQSDLFSFGLLVHEMLTGAHPYERTTPAATASAILTESPPPIAARLPRAPDGLDHILGRMLAKERDLRYPSAREIRADLESLLGRPALAAPTPRAAGWRFAVPVAVTIVAVLAIVLFADWFRVDEPALAFKERDWVLIADFENLTGDSTFDRPLQAALALAIEQSQHVNVVPQARIREALRRMQRSTTDRLDLDLASEMAVREGVKGVIAGSVAQVGGTYVLTARLIDPRPRTAVLTESARASGRDQVLTALDDLGKRIRRRLGESLTGIQAQGRPLPLATTASLEALNLFVDARRLGGSNDDDKHINLLRQALKLDPDFAMAHAALGLALYLRNSRAEGETHFARALSLLDRLTTREQLWIRAVADDTRGNREQAVIHYRTYLAQYPDDSSAWFRLGWSYMAGLSQPEPGADAFKRALALNPSDASAQINLATCYSALRREREAVDAYHKAFATDPEAIRGLFVNHEYGFTLVRLGEIDKAADVFRTMAARKEPVPQARGHRSLALLEMYRGRYTAAASELREAILVNRANRATLSEFRDRLFLATVFDARGMSAAARDEVSGAAKIVETVALAPEWLYLLGKAHARRGQVREAERVLARLPQTAADPTAVSGINRSSNSDEASARLLRGEVAMARGRAAEAVQEFDLAHRVRPNSRSLEALATARLALNRTEEAADALKQLIGRREVGGESQQDWFLAHLQLGRLLEAQGKRDEALRLYDALLDLWKAADPELPAARDAEERRRRIRAGVAPVAENR